MPDKDLESPATTSAAYDAMVPQWSKIDALLGGTETMRGAGNTYLPQHNEEDEQTYLERLATAVLFNMTEKTLDMWVGKPFAEDIQLSEDMPDAVREWMEDVDLQGNDLGIYARSWFREGLAKTFAHTLVEMPRTNPGSEERPRTLADDRNENVRPYWVLVKPENLIFARATIIDGQEILTHIRIHETHVEQVGFGEVFRERIREYNAGGELRGDGSVSNTSVRLWQKVEKKKASDKEEWIIIEEWELGIPFIPLVTYYADREDLMLGKSPLIDLADLNIRHWQSNSDQIMTITVARFPILAMSGAVDEDDDLRIGPNQWLHTPDPAGRYYYVEHTGKAIAAGVEDLQRLENQMATYGLDLMKKRKGGETATGRVIDDKESTSPLQDKVKRFKDAIDLALAFTAAWVNIDAGGTAEVSTDFGVDMHTPEDLRQLQVAREKGDISRKQYLERLVDFGTLDEDFDFDANEEELDEENAKFDGAAGFDLDPGAPEPPEPEE